MIALLRIAEAVASEVLPHVDLTPKESETTYAVADWIMKMVRWVLDVVGLEQHPTLVTWVFAIIVFLLSIIIGYICKWIVLGVVELASRHVRNDFFSYLVQARFFSKFCRIIPAITFLILIQFTLYTRQTLALWLTRITWIYVIFTICLAFNTLISVIWHHIDDRENKRNLPLKGIAQLIKGIVWIVAAIIVVAILVNKSPTSLLAGLGAFAAVLMLVFKDSILGVVAGVQLSENDSLHVGDWIAVKGTDANGTVIEVSLNSVKIQNWDKTVTTLPPYQLVSGSFTNYRMMQQSNTRRIQRSYLIDADSVVATDDAMLAEIRKLPFMENFIATKLEQKQQGKVHDVNNPAGLVDGTIDTNLGLFRAYVRMYLDSLDFIDKESTCFVSTLQQTPAGIPLQIYCFTNTSAWLPYEAMQDTVFENISVMVRKFGLQTFENPSGRDTVIDGYLSSGKSPEGIFGMPVPFFTSSPGEKKN